MHFLYASRKCFIKNKNAKKIDASFYLFVDIHNSQTGLFLQLIEEIDMDSAIKAALIALKERGFSTMAIADMAEILMMETKSVAGAATLVASHADKTPKVPVDADAAAATILEAVGAAPVAAPAKESLAKAAPAKESPAMAELKAIGEAARAIGAPAAPKSYAERAALVADKPATGGAGAHTAPHKHSERLHVIYAREIKTYFGSNLRFKSADDIWYALRHMTDAGWYSIVSVYAEEMKIKPDFKNAVYLMLELKLITEDELALIEEDATKLKSFFFEGKGKAFFIAMKNVIADALEDPDVQKGVLGSIADPHPTSKWGVHAGKAAKAKVFGLNRYTGQFYFE